MEIVSRGACPIGEMQRQESSKVIGERKNQGKPGRCCAITMETHAMGPSAAPSALWLLRLKDLVEVYRILEKSKDAVNQIWVYYRKRISGKLWFMIHNLTPESVMRSGKWNEPRPQQSRTQLDLYNNIYIYGARDGLRRERAKGWNDSLSSLSTHKLPLRVYSALYQLIRIFAFISYQTPHQLLTM